MKPQWLPGSPDEEIDPTTTLVNLCRRSASRTVRDGMVPRQGSVTTVGPLYEALIIEFGTDIWSLSRASRRSPSLHRARKAIRTLGERWTAPRGRSHQKVTAAAVERRPANRRDGPSSGSAGRATPSIPPLRPVGPEGLRLGELLALEWTDIDFRNGLLTVMRNDWRGSIGAPKSGRDQKIRSRPE